ncbi:MAG: acetolactate decarboxylase, partial [Dehalococcoidia bacterium]
LNGVYDGVITLEELQKHGDFGIGTFEGLDGEMVFYDGIFYQVKADGTVNFVSGAVQTPFAAVTFFDVDFQEDLAVGISYLALQDYLDSILPTENIFYAVRITGVFSYMQTRSVSAQQKPYPPLIEVTRDQSIFEFNNVEGTIVGFRCPSYVNGINVPGYHLHFLTSSNDAGGHVLEFQANQVEVSIDYTSEFNLILPGQDSDFYQLDFGSDTTADLEEAEK